MQYSDIVGALAAGSATCNNDAVVALSVPQLNQFLATQFVLQTYQNGLAGPQDIDTYCFGGDTSSITILAAATSVPELQFPTTATANLVAVSNVLASGYLAAFDWGKCKFDYLVDLAGSYGSIAGTIPLSTTQGTVNSVGSVVIDSSISSDWTVSAQGLLADSTASANLSAAIANYYQNNAFQYTLGTLAIPTQAPPAWVVPSAFSFQIVTQTSQQVPLAHPYLAINAITNTANASPQTIAGIELIPDPATSGGPSFSAAVLMRSGLIAQNEILAAFNASAMVTSLGCSFALIYTNGNDNLPWTVAATSGAAVTSGVVFVPDGGGGNVTSFNQPWGEATPISVPLSNVTLPLCVKPGTSVALAVTSEWLQYWCHNYSHGALTFPSGNITASFSQPYATSISGGSTISISAATPTFTLTPQDLNLGNNTSVSYEQAFADLIQTAVEAMGNIVTFSGVDTFFVDSLVFPAGGLVQLSQAALPCDLYAAGAIAQALTLASGGGTNVATLGPGQQQSFAVTPTTTVPTVYSILPSSAPATVDANGTVTVDQTVSVAQAGLYVVSAEQSGQNGAKIYGSALLAVQPNPTTYMFSPGSVVVPAKGTASFYICDSQGNHYAPSAGPNTYSASSGQLAYDKITQQFAYTADGTPGPVTLTVLVGTSETEIQTVWTVAAVETLTVTASAATTQVGGPPITLTASCAAALSNLRWLIVDSTNTSLAVGTIVPVQGQTMQATYTPPTTSTNSVAQNLAIYAYFFPSDVAGGVTPTLGAGNCVMTLEPAPTTAKPLI